MKHRKDYSIKEKIMFGINWYKQCLENCTYVCVYVRANEFEHRFYCHVNDVTDMATSWARSINSNYVTYVDIDPADSIPTNDPTDLFSSHGFDANLWS